MSNSDESKAAKSKAKKEVSFWSPENLRSMAILIFAIFCFRWSVASPYHVPTASMEPTIKVGDRLLAFKLSYNLKLPFTDVVLAEWHKPEKGDIIVFRYPKNTDIDYVKRVVGVAGDRIKFVDDILYINDVAQPRTSQESDRSVLDDIFDRKEIKELYKENLNGVEHLVMQNRPEAKGFMSPNWPPVGEYTVPEDSVFVAGDNRDNSTDSRVWGEVPLSYIHGKALLVLWSELDWSPRFYRFGHLLR